jgi:hypothetical protein
VSAVRCEGDVRALEKATPETLAFADTVRRTNMHLAESKNSRLP